MSQGRGKCPLAVDMNRILVYHVHIACLVVESIVAVQLKVHKDKTIVAHELDAARYAGVFESFLVPADKNIAGCKDGGHRDDCFDHVGTVETRLIVDGAI